MLRCVASKTKSGRSVKPNQFIGSCVCCITNVGLYKFSSGLVGISPNWHHSKVLVLFQRTKFEMAAGYGLVDTS